MGNVWERRSFFWSTERTLEAEAMGLAQRLAVSKVKGPEHEHDVYLVVPGVDHNVKVREADLELKLKIDIKTDGCVRWQEKLQWLFPLDVEQSAALWAWLLGSMAPPSRIESAHDLVGRLREHNAALGLVSVDKRRVSLKLDGAKIEVGDITIAGAQRLRTFCVEGDTLENVRALVSRAKLQHGGAVFSYIELLQTALLWVPEARTAAGVVA